VGRGDGLATGGECRSGESCPDPDNFDYYDSGLGDDDGGEGGCATDKGKREERSAATIRTKFTDLFQLRDYGIEYVADKGQGWCEGLQW
jgi:hypothetical protein